MTDKNNIEDWYRDELSGYEVTPESNAWKSISNQLDEGNIGVTEENVDSWYLKELEKYESMPDKAVWNKLSARLDVSNVWDKLLVSLNRYERFIWWRNFAIEATAVVLLLWGSYYTYNTYVDVNADKITLNEEQKLENKTNHPLNDNSFLVNAEKNKVEDKEHVPVAQTLLDNEENVIDLSNSGGLSSVKEEVKKREIENHNDNILYASTQKGLFGKVRSIKASNFSDEIETNDIHFQEKNRRELNVKTLEAKEFLVKKEHNKIVFNNKRFSSHFVFGMYARRFYFGLNTGLKKQFVLTSVKEDSQFSNYNRKQLLDFGSSFGATVGLIMSDKLNIESNLNVYSSMGYKYDYKLEGQTFTEELNLNYTTMSVVAKKMNNKSTFDNKKYSTNFIGGVYVGILNGAHSKINGVKFDQTQNFKNLDLGIVLGLEQDRYITKELVITPGIRYQQGVFNTATSTSSFNSARNFSVEFNLGLKYIFLKKG
ncbi:MAG: hypothetical protein H6586_06625 [Flavobacteriales bacterium]|nr:hypothetical protein [Flavobacteriales bacterium]